MLEFAINYQRPLDDLTADRDAKLRKFELSRSEWKIARQLRDILKIYKDATLFFSRGSPNLATVLPAMDHIDKTLATYVNHPQLEHSIKAAVTVGKH
ncbi:hypothetical protein H0H92_002872, partial [Tricholoma furcatifolium]